MIEAEVKTKEDKEYDEYDCKHFAETLMQAEEIKNDSKKMAAAEKHIKKMKRDITSLDDLRKIAKEKSEYGDDE